MASHATSIQGQPIPAQADQSAGLTYRTVRTIAEIASILPDWRRMHETGGRGATYFNDPRVVTATIDNDSSVSPLMVVVERGGAIQAVAPFLRHATNFHLQFSVFTLASLSIRSLSLPGNGVAIATEAPADECLSVVFQALSDHAGEFDLLFLEGASIEADLWQYLTGNRMKSDRFSVVPAASDRDLAFRMDLPDQYDSYFQSLGASTRKSLKKRTKDLLERDGGAWIRVDAPEQVEDFLRDVDVIYADAWQSKTYGGRVRCVPGEIGRLKRIAEHGMLRSYVLFRQQIPIAFQLGFQHRDVFHAMDFGFAQQAADCGPGAVLMHLMMRDLFEHNSPRTVDLGHGDSPQKHTFRAIPQPVMFAYVIPKGRRRWFLSVQRMLTSIESLVRTALIKCRVDRFVRRILKRKKS